MKRNIEQEAAELLLDAGVSLPLLRIPIVGKTLRITMRRPTLGGIIRITRLVQGLGVTAAEMEAFTIEQKRRFLLDHGRTLARIIALCVCRGYLAGMILAPILAKMILWWTPLEYIWQAQLTFIAYLSEVKGFLSIISLTEQINPLKPTLSQKSKRS